MAIRGAARANPGNLCNGEADTDHPNRQTLRQASAKVGTFRTANPSLHLPKSTSANLVGKYNDGGINEVKLNIFRLVCGRSGEGLGCARFRAGYAARARAACSLDECLALFG
jgi:hypothetical protein